MVDAGRILIMPKGIWSNLVSYEMLDVVTQDNIAYLARQSSVGVSPKNDSSYTYWQPFGTSVTPDGETIIMNSAGNITANIDNKSLIYDDINMYVKVAIDGSTIKYDSTHGYLYVDASNFNINDLNNISITSPTNGQTLVYDSTTQKWKNGEGSVSPIDNLTSNSTTQPLSANQGRVLNNQKLEKGIISDAWNASTTYAVGQYCIYNNSLWKCLVQNNGQTPSEGTYWTKVSVANEITNVNNSFQACFEYSTDERIVGTWIDGSPIYRKVFTDTSIQGDVDAVIGNIQSLAKLVNIYGGIKSSAGEYLPLDFMTNIDGKSYYNHAYVKSNGDVCILTKWPGAYNCIVEYIK